VQLIRKYLSGTDSIEMATLDALLMKIIISAAAVFIL